MIRHWVWLIIIGMATWAGAQPQVTIEGRLKGYFLAPDGTLKVYEVPFKFPGSPSPSDLPDRLFPLWAGYYLQAKFVSSIPIQSVWLLSGNGRLLWRRHYPEGAKEETIPYQDGGWVGVKGQDGLYVRLLVRFTDGREVLVRPNFLVHFERILPLKVDWLDFIRIAEVANLLKVKGKEIWEGFSLDGIPFLLEGDGGQWVLINHPKPPKGFVRYEGPLPKVPFKMSVYVGQGSIVVRGNKREEPDGWVERLDGIWTAVLRYYPNWWVLSECAVFGYERPREPDALGRIEAIIHEAFHVYWFQRVKEPNTHGRAKSPKELMAKILSEQVECVCLIKSLTENDEDKKRQWAKAFLKQRQKRRNLEGANKEQIIFERWLETVEGLATFVSWQALKVAEASDYQPLQALKADEEFSGYMTPNEQRLIYSVMGKEVWLGLEKPHAYGLAQVNLLSKWQREWKREVLRGKSLEELLNEALKDVKVSEDLITPLKQGLWKDLERTFKERQVSVGEEKPPERTVPIRLYLPKEVIVMVARMKKEFGEPLPNLRLNLSTFSFQVRGPVWVAVEREGISILWDKKKPLRMNYEKDGTVRLQGEGLEVKGEVQVNWDENGVYVHPVEKPKKPKGGAARMLSKKVYFLLPLVLLGANPADHSSLAAQIDISGIMVGTFYDNQTQQLVYMALPVPCEPVDDYRLVDEEEYLLYLTIQGMTDTSIAYSWNGDFVAILYVTYQVDLATGEGKFNFVTRVEQPPRKGRIVEIIYDGEWLTITYEDEKGNKYTGRVKLKHPPKTGSLVAYGEIYDEGKYIESIPVNVSVYSKDEKGNIILKGRGEGHYGKEGFPEPATVILPVGRNYWAIGEPLGGRGNVCPKVLRKNIIINENQPTKITFDFYVHKGIKGRVRVETPWMPESVSKVATVCLAREAKPNEFADFTITNPDGTVTKYKKIAATAADKNILRGENWVEAEFFLTYPQPEKPDGQTYELFVFLDGPFPIPSNYHWEPKFGWRVVFVPPCKRGEGGSCDQRQIRDLGLVVTFKPVEGGNDGIEIPQF